MSYFAEPSADSGERLRVESALGSATIHRIDMWHHRRVFGRMFANVDRQNSNLMNMILEPRDITGVFEAYRDNANGRLDFSRLVDAIDNDLFREPF